MTLEKVWEEAKTLSKSTCLSYKKEEAYMYKGIKATKTDDDIKIFSTLSSHIKYNEMDKEDYKLFIMFGFRDAVHIFLKRTYKRKIAMLNKKIKEEVNSRNNKKHYDSLKVKRETLINKYSNLNK